MPIKSRMSCIMGQIESEHLELFALEFGKIAKSYFVDTIISKYRPVSTKLGQNIYFQQNLNEFFHGSNWTNWSYLLLNWKNFCIRLCLFPSIYKYNSISTKLGHSVYEHKISDEFDYG